MNDQEGSTEHVISVLDRMGIPYMIGGSVALIAWVGPRTTHDLDVVVDLPIERIPEFCAYFPEDSFYIDAEAMRDAFQQSTEISLGMYSFLDTTTGLKIDLYPLRPNDPAQQSAIRRRTTVELNDEQNATVYAPDDLLVQKLRWYAASGSERQFRDCLNLLIVDSNRPTPLISYDYVDHWVAQLDPIVEQAWATVKTAMEQSRPTGAD